MLLKCVDHCLHGPTNHAAAIAQPELKEKLPAFTAFGVGFATCSAAASRTGKEECAAAATGISAQVHVKRVEA